MTSCPRTWYILDYLRYLLTHIPLLSCFSLLKVILINHSRSPFSVNNALVLIRENGDIVLIDFGEGLTSGWVEQKHYESVTGDLLAWKRIVEFMKTRVTQ
jgi:hypothetical protein